MKTKFKITDRGFGKLEFNDKYGKECSLQNSSLASEDAIWFGISPDRMHLTQEQVKHLLPYLEHFARTGELPSPEELENLVVKNNDEIIVRIKEELFDHLEQSSELNARTDKTSILDPESGITTNHYRYRSHINPKE